MGKKRTHRDTERTRKPPKPAGGPPRKAAEPPAKASAPRKEERKPLNGNGRRAVEADSGEFFDEEPREERRPKIVAARKRETAVKEPPNVIIPALAYGALLVACYALGAYQVVSTRIVYPVFALGSFAIVAYVAIAVRFDALRSRLGVGLAAAWLGLTFLAFALPLSAAIFYGKPLTPPELRVTKAARDVAFDAEGGHWHMAFLIGHFPRLENVIEKEREGSAKEKKPRAYEFKGAYALDLQDGAGKGLKRFDGRFEAVGQQRHLSKRGMGFHEFQSISDRLVFKTPGAGHYLLKASELMASYRAKSGDKDTPLEIGVTVYPWYGRVRGAMHVVLALLAMALGAGIDFLLKAKKAPGWFGLFAFGTGILVGFANYYLSESTPYTPAGVYIFDLFIGGVLGLVVATGILYGMESGLKRVNRKYRVSL